MFAVAGYLTTIRSGSSVPCYLEAPKRCDVVKNNWWPTLATLSLSLGPKPIMGADCHGLPLSSIFCSMCHVICFSSYDLLPWMATSFASSFSLTLICFESFITICYNSSFRITWPLNYICLSLMSVHIALCVFAIWSISSFLICLRSPGNHINYILGLFLLFGDHIENILMTLLAIRWPNCVHFVTVCKHVVTVFGHLAMKLAILGNTFQFGHKKTKKC